VRCGQIHGQPGHEQAGQQIPTVGLVRRARPGRAGSKVIESRDVDMAPLRRVNRKRDKNVLLQMLFCITDHQRSLMQHTPDDNALATHLSSFGSKTEVESVPFMDFKQRVRATLRRFGLRLFTEGSLPVGTDWLRDLRWLREPPGNGAIFFDVGANIGQTTREMHEAFPTAHIFAFEPVATTFAQLQANTRDIPRLRAFPLALGAQPGHGHILVSEESVSNVVLPADENPARRERAAPPVESVEIETLARFCAAQQIEHIDVLKIDTEGYELDVLRGAEALLSAGRVRFVYVEVTFAPDNTRNSPFFPLYEHLSVRNFRFLGLSEQYFMQHNLESQAFCNARFVRRGTER